MRIIAFYLPLIIFGTTFQVFSTDDYNYLRGYLSLSKRDTQKQYLESAIEAIAASASQHNQKHHSRNKGHGKHNSKETLEELWNSEKLLRVFNGKSDLSNSQVERYIDQMTEIYDELDKCSLSEAPWRNACMDFKRYFDFDEYSVQFLLEGLKEQAQMAKNEEAGKLDGSDELWQELSSDLLKNQQGHLDMDEDDEIPDLIDSQHFLSETSEQTKELPDSFETEVAPDLSGSIQHIKLFVKVNEDGEQNENHAPIEEETSLNQENQTVKLFVKVSLDGADANPSPDLPAESEIETVPGENNKLEEPENILPTDEFGNLDFNFLHEELEEPSFDDGLPQDIQDEDENEPVPKHKSKLPPLILKRQSAIYIRPKAKNNTPFDFDWGNLYELPEEQKPTEIEEVRPAVSTDETDEQPRHMTDELPQIRIFDPEGNLIEEESGPQNNELPEIKVFDPEGDLKDEHISIHEKIEEEPTEIEFENPADLSSPTKDTLIREDEEPRSIGAPEDITESFEDLEETYEEPEIVVPVVNPEDEDVEVRVEVEPKPQLRKKRIVIYEEFRCDQCLGDQLFRAQILLKGGF